MNEPMLAQLEAALASSAAALQQIQTVVVSLRAENADLRVDAIAYRSQTGKGWFDMKATAQQVEDQTKFRMGSITLMRWMREHGFFLLGRNIVRREFEDGRFRNGSKDVNGYMREYALASPAGVRYLVARVLNDPAGLTPVKRRKDAPPAAELPAPDDAE
jgi:hypothetical protein